jgi:hypothetical protein
MNQEQHENDLKRRTRAALLSVVCVLPIFILFLLFSHLSRHLYDLFDLLATLCLVMIFPGGLLAFILFDAKPHRRTGERRSRWRDGGRI